MADKDGEKIVVRSPGGWTFRHLCKEKSAASGETVSAVVLYFLRLWLTKIPYGDSVENWELKRKDIGL